jgi:hypothetical protein
MGNNINSYKIMVKNTEERYPLKDLDVGERITLIYILKK